MSGKVLNLLLSVFTLLSWAWLVARARFPAWMQVVSLLIIAVHPAMVAYVVVLGTETLSVFLCTSLLAVAMLRSSLRWPLLGFISGFAILNRPQLLVVPMFVGGVILLLPMLRSRFCRGAIMLMIVPLLVVAPWMIRNFLTFDVFVPVSANSGYVLMVNNNENNGSGAWMPLSQVPLSDENLMAFERHAGMGRDFFAGDDEGLKFRMWTPQADKVASDVGKKWIVSNPLDFVELAWMRLKITYDIDSLMMWPFRQDAGLPNALMQITYALDLVLALLSVLGCVVGLLFRPRDRLLLSWLCALAVMFGIIAGVLLFEGQGRYLMPMLPAQVFVIMILFSPREAWTSLNRNSVGADVMA